MAFIKTWGNLPIPFAAYNFNIGGNDIITNGGVNPAQFLISQGFDTTQKRIEFAKGNATKKVPLMIGGQAFALPCKPKTSVINPPQQTEIAVSCLRQTQSGQNMMCYYDYNPNLILNIGVDFNFSNVSDAQGSYCVFGVALYSDALGTTLAGIQIIGISLNTAETLEFYAPSSQTRNVINVNRLRAMGYDVENTIQNIDPDYGPESDPDGYGDNGQPALDHTSDLIPFPDDPTVSTGSTGFMHVYNVAQGTLSSLGQYLFPQFDLEHLTDIVAVLRAFAGIFAYQDSVQYIVDLHAVPVAPRVGGSDYIKLGALETDISAQTCSSDYVDFDCGAVHIPEQYKNFLDYTGISYKCYIPFYGFVDVNPEYIVGGSLHLKYKFNIVDGSFIACLMSTSSKSQLAGSVIGQYSGNACCHLPVVAASYGAIIGGMVAGAAAISGAPTAKSGAIGQVVNGALTADNFQPKMAQSNSYNAGAAFMGERRPYLLIERQVPSFSSKYTHEHGLPLNVNMLFASLHGFTIIDGGVDLSGINAPVDVLDDIRRALTEGTIF